MAPLRDLLNSAIIGVSRLIRQHTSRDPAIMPVYIELPTEQPSQQDMDDLQKVFADMPEELLAPYTDASALLNQALRTQSLVIARFNSRLLGGAIVNKEPQKWLLSHLCVRSITRHRGVAKRMLDVLSQQACEHKAQLVLCVPQQLDTIVSWCTDNNYPVQVVN